MALRQGAGFSASGGAESSGLSRRIRWGSSRS